MDRKWIKKAELAQPIGQSKEYLTQLLNGTRNVTLRAFAGLAFR